jgi:two-component system, NtrC family, nitrogen regulation sensor histidine kinase NtrY
VRLKKQTLILLGLSLLFAAFGALTAWMALMPPAVEKVGADIQQRINTLMVDIDRQAAQQVMRLQQGKNLADAETQFLVIDDERIVQWSDNHFIPPFYTVSGNYQVKYLHLNSADFILKKWRIDPTKSLVVVIPLHIRYKIVNDYLSPYSNQQIFGKHDVLIFQPEAEQGIPILLNEVMVLKVFPIHESNTNSWAGWAAIVFFTIVIGLLVFILVQYIQKLTDNPGKAFIVLIVSILVMRAIMILIQFPVRIHALYLFDPKDFASSQWNPSMGDMLLNATALMMVCFFLFRNIKRFSFWLKPNGWGITILAATGIFFAMLYPAVVTQTVYNNSEITLSISQSLEFDVLRIAALVLLIISWISAFLFMHVMVKILTRGEDVKKISIAIVVGCFVFVIINEITGQSYVLSGMVAILYLVSVLSFTVYHSLDRFQYATFVYFFLAVICFSLLCTASVVNFEKGRRAESQHRFADNFLVERDYFGEYLMREAADKIAKDAFIQSRLANPLLGKEGIKHKINQVLLSGYFNRYTVEITTYDQLGMPFPDERDTVSYHDLSKQYSGEQFKTDYKNVLYVSGLEVGTSRKYVVLVPIKKNRTIAGYIGVQLFLKRIIPQNVYPELLVDNRFRLGYRPTDLNYAVVAGSQIEYSAGSLNYQSLVEAELANPNLYSQGIERDGYFHVGVEDASGRVAIVSTVAVSRMFQLADFSFMVLLGITAILLFLLIEGIIHYSGSSNLFFSARIQLILNLAFFVPLIAVCIITLGLTASTSRQQLQEEYLSKANQFAKAVALTMKEFGSADAVAFENAFKNNTTLASLDANLYGTDGTLIATSQPLIFENQLLASYLDPTVYRKIKRGESIFVATDYVGSLEFYVAYSKVLSPDSGEVLGILGIPFFQSGASIEHMQIAVLTNIISIFTLIFIVLLIISFFVTKWLTTPLTMITETFGRLSLTNLNKPLEWKSDDEIGLMVREYNHMLDTLSASKQELEKNQREKAWREIAQQVAHEIKNPLTPMKLTLQQLERTLQHNDTDKDKLKRAVHSLLSQINSLNDLASSFSSFAKMPEPVMKPIELVSLLSRTINLHAQEASITLQTSLEAAPVFADEQLLGRIISNIILNGIQAVPKTSTALILVTLEAQHLYFRIEVADNGVGIGPELMDKIFLPHFTTKKTGSGLGLAIAKQGIEQMGGRISFTTSSVGTVFRIELPQNR